MNPFTRAELAYLRSHKLARLATIGPDGAPQVRPVSFGVDEATKAQNIQFTQAGFYDIRRPNGRNELVAVNADRHESDLTPAAQETLSLWQNTANGPSGNTGEAAQNERKPLSLWWYVMLAVLALAVAESLLGNQHLSVDKEAA